MKFNEFVWAIIGCLIIAMFVLNAPAVQVKFATWLAMPSAANCTYIEMHKGVTR